MRRSSGLVRDVSPLQALFFSMAAVLGGGIAFILAASAVSFVTEPADWVRLERVLEPASATAETYSDLYDRYRDLYPRTAGDMHALARVEGATPPSPG